MAEVLEAVFAQNPRLRSYVLDEHGAVRKHMNVFIDGRQVRDRERLGDPVDAGGGDLRDAGAVRRVSMGR